MTKEEMDKKRNGDLDTAMNIIATALDSMDRTIAHFGSRLSPGDLAMVENDVRALNRTGQLLAYLRQDGAMSTKAVVAGNETIH